MGAGRAREASQDELPGCPREVHEGRSEDAGEFRPISIIGNVIILLGWIVDRVVPMALESKF